MNYFVRLDIVMYVVELNAQIVALGVIFDYNNLYLIIKCVSSNTFVIIIMRQNLIQSRHFLFNRITKKDIY